MAFKRGRQWWISYTEVPSGRRVRRASGPDKALAELEERTKQTEWQRFRILGGDSPKTVASLSLTGLLDQFLVGLERDERDRGYVKSVETRVQRFLVFAQAHEARDLTPDLLTPFLEHLRGVTGKRRGSKLSQRTIDLHGAALKQFGQWLVDNQHRTDNPFSGWRPRGVPERDRTFVRRAFSEDELGRLIHGTPERAVLYAFAAATGLRAGELRKLLWADIDLQERVVTLPGYRDGEHFTKNGKDVTLPLQEWVCAMMRLQHRSGAVFDVPRNIAEILRADCKRLAIPVEDRDGRVVDFHSLRSTTFTLLWNAGVRNVRDLQLLMRHQRLETTLKHYDKHDMPHVNIKDPRKTG